MLTQQALIQQLEQFANQATQLHEAIKKLKSENIQLRTKLENTTNQLTQVQTQYDQLRNQQKAWEAAKALILDEKTKRDIKKQIDQHIETIDQCLQALNNR